MQQNLQQENQIEMLPSIPHCLKVLILMYNIYKKI